ncbi:MAG: MBL fold metallo-hydrolase [Bacillus sp. (in: firmicutes)]
MEKLADRTFCIDVFDLGMERRTGCYVLEGHTLIETSSSPSVPYLLKGLEELSVDPLDIRYIIVTHIHLDHSGGAGLLLQHCPNAVVISHPKGARHLADPSRLVASAKQVYGKDFDVLFDPIVPIPAEKLKTVTDGETLDIGGRILTFFHSPGHANHHISIYDSLTNGLFSGDTAGILYQELSQDGLPFVLPSTSPNQFDPEAMLSSIERMEQLQIDRLFFGHYGSCKEPEIAFQSIRDWLPIFMECGKQAIDASKDQDKQLELAASLLMEHITAYLSAKSVPTDHSVYEILSLDCQVSAMGLIDYLRKVT